MWGFPDMRGFSTRHAVGGCGVNQHPAKVPLRQLKRQTHLDPNDNVQTRLRLL